MNSEIIKNIENGVYRIVKKTQSRSKIWEIFSQIEKDNGKVMDGVVLCEKCKGIFKFNGKQTSNLIRHKCYAERNRDVILKNVGSEDKEKFLVACSQWVVEDCRPFSIVDGDGFKKIVQSLLDIGTKYGNTVDISNMVPDSRTVSRRISDIADDKRSQIQLELKTAITKGTASITSDLWTDNFVKRNFLCATFHFLKDLKLREIVLGVKSMDFERCTANNVLTKLKSILNEFDIYDIENITFVTDRGSNIVKALRDQNRLNCANHLLNNVLDSGFNSTLELMPIFETCKKLVKYFKKSSLQHFLSTSLKNYCITRWNSHLNLFQSISNNYFKIQEILSSNNEMNRISDIDLPLLNSLVGMFEKFDIVSRKLQGVNYVTINYVYLTVNTLKNICEETDSDIQVIKALKRNIVREIETKYIPNLSILHYTACFLYPPTNSCIDEAKINEVKAFCLSEIMKSVPSSDASVNSSHFEQSPKDFQLFFSTLVNQINPSIEVCISDEINRYSYLKINAEVNFDVMQWWENHSSEYPRLYRFAQKILSIPASSAASERVFSAAGNIITEKRNRIGPKTVNNLLFLNSLFKYE